MRLKTIEFELEGFDIIATAEIDASTGEMFDVSYDVVSSDDELPSIDGDTHDTIMDYAYYLLKGDHIGELNFN